MATDEVPQAVEEKIAEALRTGATELDLSCEYDAKDSEKLTALPESLSQLTQLQSLNLSDNQLMALPEWLGQLLNLRKLSLYNTGLTVLPDWIGNFASLTRLSISCNDITKIPDSIGQLRNLQTLILGASGEGGNPLGSFPDCVRQLKGLEKIWAAKCGLRTIPPWIDECENLHFAIFS